MSHQRVPSLRGASRIPVWIAAVLLVVSLLAILVGPTGNVTSEAWDQNEHHILVVRSFAEQWPAPDLSNYTSATAPAWHLVLSLPARWGVGLAGLRAISACCGALFVWLVARAFARAAESPSAAWLALPIACSPYTLSGSIWITTDIPTMACLVAALGAALHGRTTGRCWLAAAEAIRQTSLWMAPSLAYLAWNREQTASRARRCFAALAAVAPAVFVLSALVWLWRGLVPPGYTAQHNSGANPATFAFGLSLIALWSAPLMSGAWRARGTVGGGAIACAALAGLISATVVATNFDREAGRWGGSLWAVVAAGPVVAGRSLVLLVLAPIGAMSLLLLVRRAAEATDRQSAIAVGLAIVMMMVAQTANSQCWERYFDPPMLVLLPWLAAYSVRGALGGDRSLVVAGAVVLACVQTVMAWWSVFLPLVRG